MGKASGVGHHRSTGNRASAALEDWLSDIDQGKWYLAIGSAGHHANRQPAIVPEW